MSDIFPEKPITSLPEAVAFLGALPMSVGSEPQALSVDRLAEIAARMQAATAGPWWTDTLAESDGSESVGVGFGDDNWIVPCQDLDPADAEFIAHARADVPALLTEIGRLEAQRDRRRARLVALQNDALSMRGVLSPMGEGRKVPFPLGPTLLPAVEWLIGRVAELERTVQQMVEGLNGHDCPPPDEAPLDTVTRFAVRLMEAERLLAEDGYSCPPQDRPHQVGCPLDGVPLQVTVPDEPTRLFPTVGWLREDPHDSPLHHDLPNAATLPIPEGCRLDAAGLDGVGQHLLGGAS